MVQYPERSSRIMYTPKRIGGRVKCEDLGTLKGGLEREY